MNLPSSLLLVGYNVLGTLIINEIDLQLRRLPGGGKTTIAGTTGTGTIGGLPPPLRALVDHLALRREASRMSGVSRIVLA